MVFALRFLIALVSLVLEAGPAEDEHPRTRKPKGITPEIQDWVNGIVAKETRDARTKTLAEAEVLMRQAAETAAQEGQVQREAFETARLELEQARDAALAERDGLQGDYDSLMGHFATDYAASIETLPEVIRIFAPEADAPFAEKAAWLTKAKTQAAELARLAPGGARPNPRPGDVAGEVKNPLSKRSLLN